MIRISWDNDIGDGDVVVAASGTDITHPLETSVMLSLFCDAASDESEDRRGYWHDAYDADGDAWGSKLWLMFKRKATNDSLNEARMHAEDALRWMMTDGVAREVEVETWWLENRKGYMGFLVTIYKPESPAPQYVGPWEIYYGVD